MHTEAYHIAKAKEMDTKDYLNYLDSLQKQPGYEYAIDTYVLPSDGPDVFNPATFSGIESDEYDVSSTLDSGVSQFYNSKFF